MKVTYTRAFTKTSLKQAGLQVGHLIHLCGPAFCLLLRCESAHQREHLGVMGVNIGKSRAFFAVAANGPAAIHIRVEPRVTRTFPTPAHTADLEHRNYFTVGGLAGGNAGEDTRCTTPLKASSMETL